MGDDAKLRRTGFLQEAEKKLAAQFWPLMNPSLSPESYLALRNEQAKNPPETHDTPLGAPPKSKRAPNSPLRKPRLPWAKRRARNKRREYLRTRRIQRTARVVSRLRERARTRKRRKSGSLATRW
jgi:hypothetical protein